ncbi:MAG: aldo/keto reductase [Clostridiales bacterium]|nr:aldo/keto reductase [Clostridiales bacterium]
MKYTTLGKTGLKVSVVGLGGIPVQRTDVAGTVKVIDACVETGINYIDTARGYTVSEEYLGAALEGRRDKFVIATKSMARDYEGMKADIEKSLANLRTDYIDLYQIHNIKTDAEFEKCFGPDGAYRALEEAKQAGKIGHIGATAHGLEAFERLITEFEDKIETFMFPYNIVENQGAELMKKCTEKNIAFIAMKPMAGGNLEDAILAMKYILNNPDCTIAIPGMGDAEEVLQNAAAADAGALTEEDLAECRKIAKELGTTFCRRCGYCAPCPQGINIPNNFLFVNYKRKYGLGDWAMGRYWSMPKTAEDCVKCGACEAKCPYNLPIRDMLEKVAVEMKR